MDEALWHEGDVIRKLRQVNGLKLKQLAGLAQMKISVIHKLESGRTKEPKRATLRKLAAVFGLTVRELQDLVPTTPLRYSAPPEDASPAPEKGTEKKTSNPFPAIHAAKDRRKNPRAKARIRKSA